MPVKYIEATEDFCDELGFSIFLAGGITGCPDWQQEVRKSIEDVFKKSILNIVILNPRRKNFPIDDPNAAFEQINWEYKALNHADLITYWFAKETIQPIVLYELGRFIETKKDILIGIHPEYPRRQDVEIQTCLARGNFYFARSLDEHINQIVNLIKWRFL